MASTAPFDIGTLIEATPGVYGGRPCLAGTRFPILQVAANFNAGMTPAEFAEYYEFLDLAHVYAGIAYYLANKAAIDAEMAKDEQEYAEALKASAGGRARASA